MRKSKDEKNSKRGKRFDIQKYCVHFIENKNKKENKKKTFPSVIQSFLKR